MAERTNGAGLRRLAYRIEPEFQADVRRIADALARHGYAASPSDIRAAYGEWSEASYAAGWLLLPSDDAELARVALSLVEDGYLVLDPGEAHIEPS